MENLDWVQRELSYQERDGAMEITTARNLKAYAELMETFSGFPGMLRVDAEGLMSTLIPKQSNRSLICVVCCHPSTSAFQVSELLSFFSSDAETSTCAMDDYFALMDAKTAFPIVSSHRIDRFTNLKNAVVHVQNCVLDWATKLDLSHDWYGGIGRTISSSYGALYESKSREVNVSKSLTNELIKVDRAKANVDGIPA